MTKTKQWKKDVDKGGFVQETQRLACMRAVLGELVEKERLEQEENRKQERRARKGQEWNLAGMTQENSRKSNRSVYSDGSVGSAGSSAGHKTVESGSIAGPVDSAPADKPQKRPRGERIRGGKRGQKTRGKNAARTKIEQEIEKQVHFINEPGTSYADAVKKTTHIDRDQVHSDKQVKDSSSKQVRSHEEERFASFCAFFANHKREDWNVIRRREEEELLNGDPELLEKQIVYEEQVDQWNTNRYKAKGYVGGESTGACILRIERDRRIMEMTQGGYATPGKRAAAPAQSKAGGSGKQPKGKPTEQEQRGRQESSGNAGGSGGDGGGPGSGPDVVDIADRNLLSIGTGYTCWWNNGSFPETYGLNTYFERRSKVLKQDAQVRVREEDRERVRLAYNRRFGEGFRPLRAGPNGQLMAYTQAYTKEDLSSDFSRLRSRTFRVLKDNSRETFEDCEKAARQSGLSLAEEIEARGPIPATLRQEVYEAFDRYWTADPFLAPTETESMASEATVKTHFSQPVTKGWDEMGTLELLKWYTDITFMPGPVCTSRGIPQVEGASIGQLLCGWIVEGLTAMEPLEALGGRRLVEMATKAYEIAFKNAPSGEVSDYWFKGGPLPDVTKQVLKSIELNPQVKPDMVLLATPLEGRTVEVHKKLVTETYGMNIWRFHFGESSAVEVPEQDLVTASKAFMRMLKLCPFHRLWESLFTGRDLPTMEEVQEQDENYLSTDTGGVVSYGGLDVKETYGMVMFQNRWFMLPAYVQGVPDSAWPLASDAFFRRTGEMTKDEAETLIYKTLPEMVAMRERAAASMSTTSEDKGSTSIGETAMEVDPSPQPAQPTTKIPASTQALIKEQVGQGGKPQATAFTPMPGTTIFGEFPTLFGGPGTGRGGTWGSSQPPTRYFNQPRPNMIYCRDCRMTHEVGKCRRRIFGYGRPNEPGSGQTVHGPTNCWKCGGDHRVVDCPTLPRGFEPEYATCLTCGTRHAPEEQCPTQTQAGAHHEPTTRGGSGSGRRGFAQSTTTPGRTVPRRVFSGSTAPSQASTTSVEPPKVPTQGYKPPSKRAASTKRSKPEVTKTAKTQGAPNGMELGSYLAGQRAVLKELRRQVGKDVIVTKDYTPIYTIVLAVDGYGLGYLDPMDNRELQEGHTTPLLMQFGDRLAKTEFYFFNGEKRRVLAYVSAIGANGQPEPLQPSTMELAKCIDLETGRIKANAICVKQELAKDAPSKVMRRVCIVHSFLQTMTAQGLVTWNAQVCSTDGRGGVPIQVANDYIVRRSIGFHRGEWAALDGFKVIKAYPRYRLGGALFMTQVPGSVKAPNGFYMVRMYASDCKQVLDSFRPEWQTADRVRFSVYHRTATEASGAVLHLNSVLTKEKTERSRLVVTGTHYDGPGYYQFKVSCAGLTGGDLHAACSIHGTIVVKELRDDGSEQEVMHGVVSDTEFNGDSISVIWVRHFLKFDERRLSAMIEEHDIADEEEISTTRGLEDACEMLKGVSISDGLSEDFYRKNIRGRKLTIMGKQSSFVDDAFLGMIPLLARCDVSERALNRELTANLNGLQLARGRDWTAEFVEREVAKYRPSSMETRARELFFAKRMLGIIAGSSLDDEQKQVAREMVVNCLPCVNVIAPGGTGKTQTGVNVIGLTLDRHRSLRHDRRNIVVVCPNNESATAFAHRLQELVDRRVLGQMGALVVQAISQVIDMKKEGPFSMQERARYIIKRNFGSPKMHDMLKCFLDISSKKVQMFFNMQPVLQALLKFETPDVIIVTLDSLALNPALWKFCRFVILEESSRLADLKVRALVHRMGLVEQVLVLGDPAQQTPFMDNKELEPLARFGMASISELLMWRGNVPQVVLTKNRRSVSTLVHCIRQMNPLYASMVSMVKEPEWATDPDVCAPPLVRDECPIVLLNVSGPHRISQAGMVSNEAQDSLAAGLVLVLDELNKIDGTGKLSVMVATNYNGSKHAIQGQVKKVKFETDCGVKTVDGAQGREANRTIWVTGRSASPIRREVMDFAKETRRCTVALGRPRNVLYIIGLFDYLTQEEDTPLFNYLMEANKRTPVVDGRWFLEGAQAYLTKVRDAHTTGTEAIYPGVFAFGNGVLYYDFLDGNDEFKQDHIVNCRCNIANGWKDRSWFEPETNLVGYEPPQAPQFNAPLEGPEVDAAEDAATPGE